MRLKKQNDNTPSVVAKPETEEIDVSSRPLPSKLANDNYHAT